MALKHFPIVLDNRAIGEWYLLQMKKSCILLVFEPANSIYNYKAGHFLSTY
jgi:hypothetical protein